MQHVLSELELASQFLCCQSAPMPATFPGFEVARMRSMIKTQRKHARLEHMFVHVCCHMLLHLRCGSRRWRRLVGKEPTTLKFKRETMQSGIENEMGLA